MKINPYKKPLVIFRTHRLLGYTQVGACFIPVVDAEYPTIATFKAGDLGRFEFGAYLFWTAILKKKHLWQGYQGTWKPRMIKTCIGRARAILSPGDRFDRMRIEM